MALNISIFSNANSSSKSVSVDFAGDVLASSSNGVSNELRYFFKFTTSARDTSNLVYPVKIVEKLNELVLNNAKQRISDTNAAYANVDAMITDYIYDYVKGHAANLHTSGVAEKAPMKFTS
jgi:hypothetical protein